MSGPSTRGDEAVEYETVAMAGIALGVAAGLGLAPRPILRLFGIDREDVSPTAVLAWRLFAIRNVAVSIPALRGDAGARDLFLPVQLADQVAWWEMHRRGALSARATIMAATASGAIIALDLRRRLRGA